MVHVTYCYDNLLVFCTTVSGHAAYRGGCSSYCMYFGIMSVEPIREMINQFIDIVMS